LLVPKIPSFKISDLINVLYPKCKIKITGLRPGEKIHEDLVSINETNLYDIGKFYSIYPSYLNSKISPLKNKKVSDNFMMNSGTYKQNLTFKDLIEKTKLLKNI